MISVACWLGLGDSSPGAEGQRRAVSRPEETTQQDYFPGRGQHLLSDTRVSGRHERRKRGGREGGESGRVNSPMLGLMPVEGGSKPSAPDGRKQGQSDRRADFSVVQAAFRLPVQQRSRSPLPDPDAQAALSLLGNQRC
jgi:hypothetical protein